MDAERRRAQTRERVRAHRARETPEKAAERRRRNRDRMRSRRAAAAAPAVPDGMPWMPTEMIETDPLTLTPRAPKIIGINPHTLMPVYDINDATLAALTRSRQIKAP